MAVAGSLTYETDLDKSKFEKGLSSLGSISKTALKGVGVAIGATTTALAGIGTAATSSYAELEQNVGGIQTLFKDSANTVIQNANRAYETAGMSANQYMSMATSFSASLLQSLGGDTQKAADVTDMAIKDMSDNANKMGTDMQAIQDAYQGFAKQNYTMLDNLKLGYGGTKTEMERLLADAEKITGVKYDINNLSDVYNAIHVIQGELGITGTTAKEAASTISGSVASMKAAWDNFLNGSGTVDQLVETAKTALLNILNAVGELLPQIVSSVSEAMPQIIGAINEILPKFIELLNSQLPTLLSSIGQILMAIGNAIIQYIPQLIPIALQLIQSFAQGLISYLPQILQIGIQVISELINGIAQMLPTLIPMAIDCIITLVMGLLDNIDQLIDAGINLIMGLADGLINAIPIIIEKIPTIISSLINAITNNLPRIIQMGIELIVKLALGLVQAIPQLVSKIPQIIGAIISGFGNLAANMGQVGLNLIQGLWNGISNAVGWLWGKISGFCSGIVDKIKGFFGIHSPSTLFRDEIGKRMPQGMAVGIEADTDKAINAIDKMNDEILDEMNRAVAFETGSINANASVKGNNSLLSTIQATFNIDGNVDIDGHKAGRLFAPYITKTIKAGGIA